jgi:heme/copper-type cytochrome/quinol oxidase subunit 2
MPILIMALIALAVFIVVGILSVMAARAEARAQAEPNPKQPGGRPSKDNSPKTHAAAAGN